ncbi:reverse transcriptase family protein [Wenyingzhuangia sp. IMCC45533]
MPKRNNMGSRKIYKPVYKLKFVQRVILDEILSAIELPNYFFGGIKKRDFVKNAKYHSYNSNFLLLDFKNFFNTINYRMIYFALIKENIPDKTAKLITRICTKKGYLIQGSPTSSFLSALVLKHEFKSTFKLLQKEKFVISVYVDDITISSDTNFKNKQRYILRMFKHKYIKINPAKTEYRRNDCEITGVLLRNKKLYPGNNLNHSLRYFKSVDSYIGCYCIKEYIEKISNGILYQN